MAHPLHDKLDILRTRVRRLVLVHGLSAVAAAAVGAVIVLGLADYTVGFQDRGIRLIASLAVLGLAAWTWYRYLVRPLIAGLRELDLAARVQERFPTLGDRLVTAVEFLRQPEDDPAAGSSALRQAVIAQAQAQAAPLDFAEALDRRPARRAAALAMGVFLIAAVLVVLHPAASQTALARLLAPLGNTAWPQKTHLEIRPPVTRVARGQPFEVQAVDAHGAPLPEEVRIHYRFEGPDGTKTVEVERMKLLEGAMFARRENVTRPFEYRVEGGDDQTMDWIGVEVIEPPAIRTMTVTLYPPAYTGWPAATSDRGWNLRALAGTRVRIEASVTRPLASAALCLEGGGRIPAKLSDNGQRFTVGERPSPLPLGEGQGEGKLHSTSGNTQPSPYPSPKGRGDFTIEESGTYWFRLTDPNGVHSDTDPRWEIRAIQDAPPTVAIEQPSSNLYVTPRAMVPLWIVVKDDLGVRDVSLVASRADQHDDTERRVRLLRQPEPTPRGPDDVLSGSDSADRRSIAYDWELASLNLSPGMQLAVQAVAYDHRGQSAKSESRLLTVVTPDELQDRIAVQQGVILARLAAVLKLQRDGRAAVQSLQARLGEPDGLGQPEVDRLKAAEQGQRQVGASLTAPRDGAIALVRALLADLENNRLDSPDVERRMRGLLEEIGRLEREPLPAIGRELTAAIKAAQVGLERQNGRAKEDFTRSVKSTQTSLAEAGRQQDEVIRTLEAALGLLQQLDDYRRFHRDLAQLLRDQEQLARAAAEAARRTLTRELKDLAPQELADLKELAGRQLDLALRLDRLEQDMEQAGRDLRPSNPKGAETVARAVAESRRLAISALMRVGGSHLQENRMGQVVAGHKQIAEGLQTVLDLLASRRKTYFAQLEDFLKQSSTQQQSVLDQTRQFATLAAAGPLTREQLAALLDVARLQQSLQAETAQQAEKMAESKGFASVLVAVRDDMARAAGLLDHGQAGPATQEAEQSALGRIAQMLKALEPETADGKPEPRNGGSSTPGGKQAGPGGAVSLADLKLLRLMQDDLNIRTEELDRRRAAKEPADQLERQYLILAAEQGRLADLAAELLRPAEPPKEDTP